MKVTVEKAGAQEETPPPPTDLPEGRRLPRKLPRRRTRHSGGGVRLTRESVVLSPSRGSRPGTPFLSWMFDDGVVKNDDSSEIRHCGAEGRGIRAAVSARKIAASLWRMSFPDVQSDLSGAQNPNSAMEMATKWDPVDWKSKPSRHQSLAAISALEAELDQAKSRIIELETDRRSSKRKIEEFLHKLREEKAAWRSREHDKVRAVMDDMKGQLTREKKNRQRLETVNSKLVNDLANAKLSAKRYAHEYEKEQRARELIEELCDELAKEIREDKAEAEELKVEAMRAQEEVEEERKMLQVAEVWREERMQMKLVDAKVMLEEKYSQMNELVAELEFFLGSTAQPADSDEIKKAHFLKQAAASVDMREVRSLKYEPPNPDEIFSIFKDFDTREPLESGDEQSVGYSSVTPEMKKLAQGECNGQTDHQSAPRDDTSEWETVSQHEDQGSSYSAYESDPSIGRHFSVRSTSMAERHSRKDSSLSKLWKSCAGTGSGDDMTISKGARLSNGELSNSTISRENGGFSSLAGQWSSPESGNPHTIRAKGRLDAADKSSLKARLMEARMENQKIQLRQALQQKT